MSPMPHSAYGKTCIYFQFSNTDPPVLAKAYNLFVQINFSPRFILDLLSYMCDNMPVEAFVYKRFMEAYSFIAPSFYRNHTTLSILYFVLLRFSEVSLWTCLIG